MSHAANEAAAALRAFATELTSNFASFMPAQPEDQLKGPVGALLRDVGATFDMEVSSRTEVHPVESEGRPDLGVAVGGLLCGYVELKAPGRGARPERFRGREGEQFRQFTALPNLLYTDASEWSLFRSGKLMRRHRLTGDAAADGRSAVADADVEPITLLLRAFLSWEPIVPTSPRALAQVLAPLCHLIRQDARAALGDPGSAMTAMMRDWRAYLFPDTDEAQFADAYAQTITYALLLARLTGAPQLDPASAARTIAPGHQLLAQTLRILTDEQARPEISTGVELLERAIGAVDPARLRTATVDPWLYFYEDFLAAYDPKLRKDRGVYYTPAQVVGAQVRLVADLLEHRFDKPLAYADDDVILLDPATGTGTYPLAAIGEGLRRVEGRFGPGAVAARATELARNTDAFELLIGPYTVAHLRLTQEITAHGGSLPADGVHVYLTDTLESPYADPPGFGTFLYRPLTDEHRRAQRVKSDTRVLVCLGNPPYDRQQIEPGDMATVRKGGWVRHGGHGVGDRALLEDFLEPARKSGAGVHLKNLYNDYVYFWRWALWKVFDSTQGPGIVSFITAASYLRGPGFVGMREVMRQTLDELWIIDLEGDDLGARRSENVFAIRTPVAIALGMRHGEPQPGQPAAVHYARLVGTRVEKLAALDTVRTAADLKWDDCPTDWQAPFLPRGHSEYFTWPLLTDLFPWQHSGIQFKRTWPIAEEADVLAQRWSRLLGLAGVARIDAFHPTRDRSLSSQVDDLDSGMPLPALEGLAPRAASLKPVRYGFRSFDRKWILPDPRLADFPRPALWRTAGPRQVFLTSLLSGVLGAGPAAVVSSAVPDLHHFRGSFGGKDVIPLWRDPSGVQPNITAGIIERLRAAFGRQVSPEDLFAYVYAVLATPTYVATFSDDLAIPGLHIPVTWDGELFARASHLGRRLIWLHTYGQRFLPEGVSAGSVPQGSARNTVAVPDRAEGYPETFAYDAPTETLRVGDGSFAPVSPAIWSFAVSGFQVVRSWLGYRMAAGAGRRSSPLDAIRPQRWTATFTRELLELLWVLDATVAQYPELDDLLGDIVTSPCFTADELPSPSPRERLPPAAGRGGERRIAEQLEVGFGA